MTAYDEFAEHLAECNDLLNILNILKWDMRTKMPAGGAGTRGSQLATLAKLTMERFISAKTARLLDAAEAESGKAEIDPYQARALQQTRSTTKFRNAYPRNWWGASPL